MGTVPELPDGYYLTHFLTLLDEVERFYGDILAGADKDFSHRFRRLSVPAARLYVRLISRKGPLFRTDKLRYPEITGLESAADELIGQRLAAESSRDWELPDVLSLLTRKELAALPWADGYQSERRSELLQNLERRLTVSDLLTRLEFRILEPLATGIIKRYLLLFFGNTWQDLSELVVTELGVVRYETYQIDRSSRLFRTAEALDRAIEFREFIDRFGRAAEARDTILMEAAAAEAPDVGGDPDAEDSLAGIRNTLARQLEREARYDEALRLYRTNTRPPSRERQARIQAAHGSPQQALLICREILESPVNEAELEFAARFLPRVLKKRGRQTRKDSPTSHRQQGLYPAALPVGLTVSDELQTEQYTVPRPPNQTAEDAALQCYLEQGWSGFFLENKLWCGLFGLAFWDIVFSSIPGAFTNRFQRGPRGLHSRRFRKERETAVHRRLDWIRKDSGWRRLVLDIYDSKEGLANWLVSWRSLNRKIVATVSDAVPGFQMAAIFDRLSRNPGLYASGFPDLFLYRESSEGQLLFRLVEVKGPGDQLRTNQRLWIRYLGRHGVPAAVCRLDYTPA